MVSVFMFGMLIFGASAHAMVGAEPVGDGEMQIMLMNAEPMPPMEEMMREMPPAPEHECPMAKMKGGCDGGCDGGCEKKMSKGGDCPMKKMMGHHGAAGGILYKVLHCLGMLLCLFVATIVVRKGWIIGGKCCMKNKCCGDKKECKK